MTPSQFAELGIDSATILQVTSWGFGLVMGTYLFGWVVGLALSLIRKL